MFTLIVPAGEVRGFSLLTKSLCLFYCKEQFFLKLFKAFIRWKIQTVKAEKKKKKRRLVTAIMYLYTITKYKGSSALDIV